MAPFHLFTLITFHFAESFRREVNLARICDVFPKNMSLSWPDKPEIYKVRPIRPNFYFLGEGVVHFDVDVDVDKLIC